MSTVVQSRSLPKLYEGAVDDKDLLRDGAGRVLPLGAGAHQVSSHFFSDGGFHGHGGTPKRIVYRGKSY